MLDRPVCKCLAAVKNHVYTFAINIIIYSFQGTKTRQASGSASGVRLTAQLARKARFRLHLACACLDTTLSIQRVQNCACAKAARWVASARLASAR